MICGVFVISTFVMTFSDYDPIIYVNKRKPNDPHLNLLFYVSKRFPILSSFLTVSWSFSSIQKFRQMNLTSPIYSLCVVPYSSRAPLTDKNHRQMQCSNLMFIIQLYIPRQNITTILNLNFKMQY